MKGRGIGMVKLRERISVKDVGLLLIGAVIYSIGTHAFMVPANIAPGGASGIALMVNYLTDLPVGALTLVLNIPLFNTGLVLSQPPFRRHNGSSEHRMLSDSGSGGGSHLPGV